MQQYKQASKARYMKGIHKGILDQATGAQPQLVSPRAKITTTTSMHKAKTITRNDQVLEHATQELNNQSPDVESQRTETKEVEDVGGCKKGSLPKWGNKCI
jgi:hypothetical protein